MTREFGSEFSRLGNKEDLYFRNLFSLSENLLLLRSGREALGAIAQFHKHEGSTILIPAYACSSMVTPFTYRGWNVEFYPLKDNFVPDRDFLSEAFKRKKISAILLMNYWGIVDFSNLLSWIKSQDERIITVIDQTHFVFSIRGLEPNADYYVGSIRKWLGISDGAFLLAKRFIQVNGVLGNSFFTSTRGGALEQKEEYVFTLNASLKSDFRSKLVAAEKNLDHCREIHPMSYSNMFYLNYLDCSEITFARKRNYDKLLELLNQKGVSVAYSSDFLDVEVPFSIPILVENRDEAQRKFAQNGLYAAVLWPLCSEASGVCPLAEKMANHMLSIPIDQRYTAFDMEEIFEIILKNLQ